MTFNEILSQLDGVTGGGNQWYAKCPAHVDNKPSLSISTGKDGRVLLNCHAGCTTEEIVDAMGLTMNDLFQRSTATDDFKGAGRSPVVARYDYQDADGTFLAQKLRRADKSFAWRRPDGHGGWIYNRQGLTIPPYNLPDVLAADHIYIVEGEKDADTLSSHGKIAVCGADGAGPGKWRSHYTGWFKGKSVTILQDNDDVGKAFAAETAAAVSKVAKSVKLLDLTREWPELPEHGDISDILQSGDPKLTLARVESLEAITPEWSGDLVEDVKKKLKIRRMSEIKPKRAEYLLYPYLPRGKLTIMGGVSGSTKTWLILNWAAIISQGAKFITDDEFTPPRKPAVVIYQTKENDYETDIRPRLDKLGANLDNILVIDDHDEDGNGFPLTLSDGRIEDVTEEYHPDLIIFDPIQSYIGSDVDFHRANEIRPILDKLIDIASRYNCAVVLISHMSKQTTASALDRLLGTSDFRNAARSILIVGSDPFNKDSRVMAHAKNSLGVTGKSIRYHIDSAAGVIYDGFCELDEDTIVKPRNMFDGTRNKPAIALREAIDGLQEFVGDHRAVRLDDVQAWAQERGISRGTLYNAKKELALQTVRVGYSSDMVTWWLDPEMDREEFKKDPPDTEHVSWKGEWPP